MNWEELNNNFYNNHNFKPKSRRKKKKYVEEEIKGMRNNAVNIEFLKKRTEKLTEDVEKIIRNGNGSKH